MMHWKTLQTTIGAFALGICLTTVVSPSQADPSSALEETLKNALTKIFQPLEDETVGKIYGENVSISDKEYLGVFQNYINAKERKRAKNSTINTGKGKTIQNTLDPIHAHPDIKSKFEEFILQAYPILGLDNQKNPLGAKTEAKKKSLIEKLEQSGLSTKERYKTQKELDELFSDQLKKLSEISANNQGKNPENPLLVNMIAMKLIDILTPYQGKTIDNLILANDNIYPFFMFNFIDQPYLKAYNYDEENVSRDENLRVFKLLQPDLRFCAYNKASSIIPYMDNAFKIQFEKKLQYWPKEPSPILKKKMNTQKEIEALDIRKEELKKGTYHITLTETQKNAIYNALKFYSTEAKGLGVWSGWLVAAFWDLVDKTPGEKVSLMRNASGMKIAQEQLGHLEQHMKDAKQDFKEIQKRIQYGNHTLGDLKNVYNALKKVSDTKKFHFSEKLQSRGLDFIVQELS